MNNNTYADKVQEFLSACGQLNLAVEGENVDVDALLNQVKLYQKLIDEEYAELADSITGTPHWVKESCDLIWVIIARMLTLGVDVNSAFSELHRSNMSKTVNGKVIRRDDGKILKPDTYSDADMTPTLYAHCRKTTAFRRRI